MFTIPPSLRRLLVSGAAAVGAFALTACGGGGSGGGNNGTGNTPPNIVGGPSVTDENGAFATSQSTARFLTQATFGPTPAQISNLTGTSASDWFASQLTMAPTLARPEFENYLAFAPDDDEEDEGDLEISSPSFVFWKHSMGAPDQLRMRMAFALSQILVVSDSGGEILFDHPMAMIAYQDLLRGQAFGNYRDLLEAITYNPAMGEWLTFIGNQKADDTGRVPDENYARELLQLFTVGLVELEPNGEPRRVGGEPVELFTNADVTGLARVFTGLDLAGLDREEFPILEDALFEVDGLPESFFLAMSIDEDRHSSLEKRFLNCAIPAGTRAQESITRALDCIMTHPNVAPFVSRQLIQRFTTSDPEPAYVERVAAAFDAGRFTLPDGRTVGDGRKGDLPATLAAILFDPAARMDRALSDPQFGKIREPVLRFTQWARAFDVDTSKPEYALELGDVSQPSALSQHPHRARSVFNFYRPGYVAPGTRSGEIGMTVPELQLVNATSTTGYINFMTFWAFGGLDTLDLEEAEEELREQRIPFNSAELAEAWRPDYDAEIALADDPPALIARLDRILTYGSMSAETKAAIEETIGQIPLDDPEDEEIAELRVMLAVLLVMTSPDFLVQR